MNVILAFGCGEDWLARTGEIDKALDNSDHNGFYEPVGQSDYQLGGEKNLEANLFVAAFNYMPLPKLVDAVRSANWNAPDLVQLFIKDDDDDRFHEVTVMSAEEAAARIRARQEERANDEYEREHVKAA
jgi:hypothetical protein